MSQTTTFCAPCALLRLDHGDPPALALAGLPRDGARIGHPVCTHHLRMLSFEEVEAQVKDGVQYHYNGTPVVEMVGLTPRDLADELHLIGLVRSGADVGLSGVPGMLHMLRHRLVLWQWDLWLKDHSDDQPTTVLPPLEEIRAEEAANEEMFRRIGGYLALRAAGLDDEPVTIEDNTEESTQWDS